MCSAAFASGASATSFTVQSFAIDASNNGGSGVFGTVNPVFDLTGALGLTSGNTSFASTDVLVVSLTLDPGSASVGGIQFGDSAPLFGDPVGAGSFADLGAQAPSSAIHLPFNFATGGVGDFTFLPDPLEANETSVRLFVTYSLGLVPNIGDIVNFMISSGADFTVQPTIVPEPATVTLLLLGIGALATRRVTKSSRGIDPGGVPPT